MMKIPILIFLSIILLSATSITAQSTYSLTQCKNLARENFPKLKQVELLQQITEHRNKNTRSSYLPQIDLKGQATYQSEVIEIDLPLANFEFDPLSNDQYKMYIDVKQTIWDGGISKAQEQIENAGLVLAAQKIEIEIEQMYIMVESYFYSAITIDQSSNILNMQHQILGKQIERMKSAVKEGAARGKDLLKLEVENLLLEQKSKKLASNKKSLTKVLGILIGKEINNSDKLEVIENKLATDLQFSRPELEYFKLQKNQLAQGDKLLEATRKPMLFGFGQAGYGKPGFNMLKNEFDPYFIVGAGISWRVSDWKNTQRNKEINALNGEMITAIKDDFLRKQKMQLTATNESINNLNQLLDTDIQLVEMRTKIAETASLELTNGTITSSDYIIDLHAETIAKINFEIHKIQLQQAIAKYNSILGHN